MEVKTSLRGTGASQSIGDCIARAFLIELQGRRQLAPHTTSGAFAADNLAWWMEICRFATATKLAETAIGRVRVERRARNSGSFFTKTVTNTRQRTFGPSYRPTWKDFLYLTQLATKQMLSQKTGWEWRAS